MKYSRDGNLHRLIRVTGPSHNLLGIEFGTPTSECVIERLGTGEKTGGLNDSRIRAWVLAAVAKAGDETGVALGVRRIQYVADDTPDPLAYELLARELVSRARTAP